MSRPCPKSTNPPEPYEFITRHPDNPTVPDGSPCAGFSVLPNSLPAQDWIVVIGDIHGDMKMLLHILIRVARVIDENGDWVARPPNTVIVQLGDQIDSCRGSNCANLGDRNAKANDLLILKFFTYLHQVAVTYGGGVYSLLGNHELMNVAGQFGYLSHRDIMVFAMSDSDSVAETTTEISESAESAESAESTVGGVGDKRRKQKDRSGRSGLIKRIAPQHQIPHNLNGVHSSVGDRELAAMYRTTGGRTTEWAQAGGSGGSGGSGGPQAKQQIPDWTSTIFSQANQSPLERAMAKRKEAFRPGSKWSRFLACTRQSAITIGSWMFVHASITESVARMFPRIEDLNDTVRRWLLAIIQNDAQLNQILNVEASSPFWNRILGRMKPGASSSDKSCSTMLKTLVDTYGMRNMVIAHTPQLLVNSAGINATCVADDGEGRIWRVDTGAAHAFDEFHQIKGVDAVPQVLEILNDNQVRVLS